MTNQSLWMNLFNQGQDFVYMGCIKLMMSLIIVCWDRDNHNISLFIGLPRIQCCLKLERPIFQVMFQFPI